MLWTGVITHGYNPIYLLTGTYVSLPKDTHGNICDSDNYKGICLCSCITKVLEWCMMLRYSNKLATSGLQFSFKSGSSTTMCNLITKEIVKYYWNRHSRVYVAFIDASKAFDRIKYDCLFGILIKRGLPSIIIRVIIDLYERQESRAMWNNEYGDYFKCIHGVRQSGVYHH